MAAERRSWGHRAAAREIGTIIARWDTEKALLRTDGGLTFAVAVDSAMRAAVDVGLRAWIEFDDSGRMVQWGIAGSTHGHDQLNGHWH